LSAADTQCVRINGRAAEIVSVEFKAEQTCLLDLLFSAHSVPGSSDRGRH